MNIQKGFDFINDIRSVYGRDNFEQFLQSNLEKGNLIAINKEKVNEMLCSIGKWYPKENTFISFDSSIAYSMQNVKGFEKNLEVDLSQKNEKKQQQSKPSQKKLFTFSRTKLNENAKKIKEQSVENKHRDRSKKRHRDG